MSELRQLLPKIEREVELGDGVSLFIREMRTIDSMVLSSLLKSKPNETFDENTKNQLLAGLTFTKIESPSIKNPNKKEVTILNPVSTLEELMERVDMPLVVFNKIVEVFLELNSLNAEQLEK